MVNNKALVDNYMLTKYLDPNTVPTNTKGFRVTMVDHMVHLNVKTEKYTPFDILPGPAGYEGVPL